MRKWIVDLYRRETYEVEAKTENDAFYLALDLSTGEGELIKDEVRLADESNS